MGVIFNRNAVLRRKFCPHLSVPRLPGGLLLLGDQKEIWRGQGQCGVRCGAVQHTRAGEVWSHCVGVQQSRIQWGEE